MSLRWLFGIVFIALISCGEVPSRAETARILLLGDSMMAFNRGSGTAVSDAIEDQLGEEVVDRSVSGARMN
jgi:acyl-CoA thioesterase-1